MGCGKQGEGILQLDTVMMCMDVVCVLSEENISRMNMILKYDQSQRIAHDFNILYIHNENYNLQRYKKKREILNYCMETLYIGIVL